MRRPRLSIAMFCWKNAKMNWRMNLDEREREGETGTIDEQEQRHHIIKWKRERKKIHNPTIFCLPQMLIWRCVLDLYILHQHTISSGVWRRRWRSLYTISHDIPIRILRAKQYYIKYNLLDILCSRRYFVQPLSALGGFDFCNSIYRSLSLSVPCNQIFYAYIYNFR